jgi:hypothetical protein
MPEENEETAVAASDRQPDNPLLAEMQKILDEASSIKFVQGTAHFAMTDPTLSGKPLEQAVRYVASRIRSICKIPVKQTVNDR